MRSWFLRADVLMVLVSAPAYVATREVLSVLSPQDLTPLRYLVSAALLGLFLVARRRRPALTRRDVPRMLAVALCGYGGYGLLLNFGQATVPAGTTSLLLNISPVFISPVFAFVLGYFILVERTTLRGYLGMGVAVLGVVMITLGDATATGFQGNTLLIVAAALLLSIFLIVQQPLLARVPAVEVVFWGCLIGGLATLPTARFDPWPAQIPASVGVAFVVLIVLGTVLAYSFWNVTLARTSVAEGGSLLLVIPIFSVLLGWALLGEVPSMAVLLGGAAALLGVAMLSSATHARAQAGPGLLTGAIPIIAALPIVSVLTGSMTIIPAPPTDTAPTDTAPTDTAPTPRADRVTD